MIYKINVYYLHVMYYWIILGSESDLDSLSESDIESDVERSLNEDIVEKSLTNNFNSVKLGDWEKHTKVIKIINDNNEFVIFVKRKNSHSNDL